MWAELERLAKVAGAEKRLAEIYATELSALSSRRRVERQACAAHRRDLRGPRRRRRARCEWYRRAHEFEPESRELFKRHRRAPRQGGAPRRARPALPRGARLPRATRIGSTPLHTIAAAWSATSSSEPEHAIETYRAALDVDDDDARGARRADRALPRARPAPGPRRPLPAPRRGGARTASGAAPFRLALARLLPRHGSRTPAGAIDQLEAIVGEVPSHARGDPGARGAHPGPRSTRRGSSRSSAAALRGGGRLAAARPAERGAASASPRTPARRSPCSGRRRKLWETRGNDELQRLRRRPGRRSASIRTTARRAPSSRRLAEQLGAWEELAESLETGVTATSDERHQARAALRRWPRSTTRTIDDPRRALRAYARLSALDPSRSRARSSRWTPWPCCSATGPRSSPSSEKKSEMASATRRTPRSGGASPRPSSRCSRTRRAPSSAYERALELDPRAR